MNRITVTMPYYDSPQMLAEHLKQWRHYPYPITDNVKAVIVDDGSPNYPAIDVFRKEALPDFPVELYRIKENIPWNHGGARNLAFTHIKDGWVVSTDMDHVMPVLSALELLRAALDPGTVYYPERYAQRPEIGAEKIHTHIDSFILTPQMYWRIGGFDESLSGFWNGCPRPFRRAVRKRAKTADLPGVFLLRYGADIVKDASVTKWGREGSEYDIKNNPAMSKRQKEAMRNYQPEKPLRFTWERQM